MVARQEEGIARLMAVFARAAAWADVPDCEGEHAAGAVIRLPLFLLRDEHFGAGMIGGEDKRRLL